MLVVYTVEQLWFNGFGESDSTDKGVDYEVFEPRGG